MADLTRHRLSSLLLSALRRRGLGFRDLFEGRQEPLTWCFRVAAYDQSELDILAAGVLDALHAPCASVELLVDELALGIVNIGVDALSSYLVGHDGRDPPLEVDPEIMLGFVHVDVTPPALWFEEWVSHPGENERLASRITRVAQQVGEVSDAVEVHIEGAVDPSNAWDEGSDNVRPAGVAMHFSFDIPLQDCTARSLTAVFDRAAEAASAAGEAMRTVFREEAG